MAKAILTFTDKPNGNVTMTMEFEPAVTDDSKSRVHLPSSPRSDEGSIMAERIEELLIKDIDDAVGGVAHFSVVAAVTERCGDLREDMERRMLLVAKETRDRVLSAINMRTEWEDEGVGAFDAAHAVSLLDIVKKVAAE